MSDEPVIGEGTSTLDYLYTLHPWLKEKILKKNNTLLNVLVYFEDEREHCSLSKRRFELEKMIRICKVALLE